MTETKITKTAPTTRRNSVVAPGAGRIGISVIPDLAGGRALGEEEQVGADAGVGIEHAVGQADDDVDALAGRPVAQGAREGVVDEVEQGLAGDAFLVGRLVAPAEMLWNGRAVVVLERLALPLAVVEDFQEEHPGHLLDALGVAVGAGVLAHDVLDGFDEVGDVGHGLLSR